MDWCLQLIKKNISKNQDPLNTARLSFDETEMALIIHRKIYVYRSPDPMRLTFTNRYNI